MGFNFTDEKENPLPSDLFANTQIGRNLRGSFTDLNIYSSYFNDKDMIRWTTGCDHSGGDIFAWDTSKLKLSEKIDVSIVKMDKKEVCPDIGGTTPIQKPKKNAIKIGGKRYKPRSLVNESFVGSVLEMLSCPETLTYDEVEDICFRVNGDLMMYPQTKEEMDLMDKIMWDYILQKVENNMSVLEELPTGHANTRLLVRGLTPVTDEDSIKRKHGASYEPRELTYPNHGKIDLIHPRIEKPLTPYGRGTILWPLLSAN